MQFYVNLSITLMRLLHSVFHIFQDTPHAPVQTQTHLFKYTHRHTDTDIQTQTHRHRHIFQQENGSFSLFSLSRLAIDLWL